MDLPKAFDKVKLIFCGKFWLPTVFPIICVEFFTCCIITTNLAMYWPIGGGAGISAIFCVNLSVRQRGMLSGRLLRSVLQPTTRKLNLHVGHANLDLRAGLPGLVDLRFANNTLLFARSSSEASTFVGYPTGCLAEAGIFVHHVPELVLTGVSEPLMKCCMHGRAGVSKFGNGCCSRIINLHPDNAKVKQSQSWFAIPDGPSIEDVSCKPLGTTKLATVHHTSSSFIPICCRSRSLLWQSSTYNP